jgi:hypothetical protein
MGLTVWDFKNTIINTFKYLQENINERRNGSSKKEHTETPKQRI